MAATKICPFETPPRTPPQMTQRIPMAPMKAPPGFPTPNKYNKNTPLLISGNQPVSPYLINPPSTPVDSEKGGVVWVSSLPRTKEEPNTEESNTTIFRAKSPIGEICPEDMRSLVEIVAQVASKERFEEVMSNDEDDDLDLEVIVKNALGDNYP